MYGSDYRSSGYPQSQRKRKNEFEERPERRRVRSSNHYDNRRQFRRPRTPSSSYSTSSMDDEVGHYQGDIGSVIKNRCQCQLSIFECLVISLHVTLADVVCVRVLLKTPL
jgi:hypothetical protein